MHAPQASISNAISEEAAIKEAGVSKQVSKEGEDKQYISPTICPRKTTYAQSEVCEIYNHEHQIEHVPQLCEGKKDQRG